VEDKGTVPLVTGPPLLYTEEGLQLSRPPATQRRTAVVGTKDTEAVLNRTIEPPQSGASLRDPLWWPSWPRTGANDVLL
jgi:hypothetical protein